MGAYTLLQDLTVSTNSTSVVLNDFGTITKDDFIKVVITFVNATSSNNVISLFGNTATTATDYHRQQLQGAGTSVSADRINDAFFTFVKPSATATNFAFLKLSENDRFNRFGMQFRENASDLHTMFIYSTSSGATFANGIDTLTFTSNQTNGIGTGSRIQIYKLDAQKVEDITVASNTTQVDISNLSIDKDSEYLLVSDLNNIDTNTNEYLLTPNDVTTQSSYYYQRIGGTGTTTFANRINQPNLINVGASQRGMAYAHIKLSNIGAYTHQSYSMREYGTSSVNVENYFVSSTSEAITSITKLNIVSAATNGIGAGSRFTLYKLYE